MRRALTAVLLASMAAGCSKHGEERGRLEGTVRLVFAHQPLWGDPAAFAALLDGFRRAHPEIELTTRLLPNAPEIAHQYFLTALEGGSAEVDVMVVDVVWVAEFAHAGWIADLSADFPPERLRTQLLPGPAEAVIIDGRSYAVPWYVDVGLLYRRTDLVPEPPRTYDELVTIARAVRAREPAMHGYVWQGRQYEGLVCNAYEAMWGHGAETMRGERLLLDDPRAREGLGYLRSLILEGVSPSSVTVMTEEETRRAFQSGRAVFMRNWPYAYSEAQREGSPIRGRVGVSPLPTESGEPGFGALGGWNLAVSAQAARERRRLAAELVRYLTTPEAALTMALAYARIPPARAAYDDPRLSDGAPFIASLLPIIERARPRPVTPYYPMLSDTLQAELSAAITGIRTPAAALARAQRRADHLTSGAPR